MKLTLLLLVFLLCGCASAPLPPENSVTPSALNSARDAFDGKRVIARGWMQSEIENYALWDSRSAQEAGDVIHNCVSLLIPAAIHSERFHNRYVVVEGVFLKTLPTIALGMCNVTVIQLDPTHPPAIASMAGG
jgi:hypothetical protein